jgi:hypothetical protein
MSAAALLLLLPLVPAWADDDPEPPSMFAALGRGRIKSLMERNEKNHRTTINGTDGNNELPNGTIVLYVTNEKNYGKFQVVKHGEDLVLAFVTYDAKGAVLTKEDKHVVRGSWQLDLDYGGDGGKGKSRPDFWWRCMRNVRELVSENGAAFLIHKPGKK